MVARLTPTSGLFAVSTGGLVGGLVALAGGSPGTAAVLWAATTALGLVAATAWVVASLRQGRVGADIVAVLALAGALVTAELLAGAIVALMLASGRMLERWAEGQSRRELTALVSRVPRTVSRLGDDDDVSVVDLQSVRVDDRLLVRTGEVVPVDGTLLTPAVLDEAALTGEAMPVERPTGDLVRSGVVVTGPPAVVRATTTSEQSTYAGIVRLVQQAQASGAPFVRMADRIAAWFVPLTIVVATVAWVWSGDPNRAVAVLVVATPCPLILAAPIALVAGMAQSARRGAVIKGGAALERLALGRVVLFDKTGTLTAGRPELAQVVAAPGRDPDQVLRLAASLDQASPHVLAAAVVVSARSRGLELVTPSEVVESSGRGVAGRVEDHRVSVGKLTWLAPAERPEWLQRARRRSEVESALLVLVSIDDCVAGALLLVDPLRPDAPRMVRALRSAGVERVVLVTGDRAAVAETVGHAIDIDEVFAERLPDEKLAIVRSESGRGCT
ncbi:MAG: heavy metal translocating P-type ATPase, partial [Actinomycetes bacterium]